MSCRLLAFCAHVAARLPFKRCDEPYTLLHHINATISRRAAFVLSAQKASLNATAQRDVQPNAHASTDPQQEGPADPRDNGAAPGDDDRAMQHEGGARQSAMSGSEAVAAETPGDAVGDQVRIPAVNATCAMRLVISCVLTHVMSRHVVSCRV